MPRGMHRCFGAQKPPLESQSFYEGKCRQVVKGAVQWVERYVNGQLVAECRRAGGWFEQRVAETLPATSEDDAQEQG